MAFDSALAVTPISEDLITDYLPAASPVVARHGGQYLARTAGHEQLAATATLSRLREINS